MTDTDAGLVIGEADAGFVISGAADAPPNRRLIISCEGNDLVTFDMGTGEMTFGESYTPEGAARTFWDAMAVDLGRRILLAQEGKCIVCGQAQP